MPRKLAGGRTSKVKLHHHHHHKQVLKNHTDSGIILQMTATACKIEAHQTHHTFSLLDRQSSHQMHLTILFRYANPKFCALLSLALGCAALRYMHLWCP